MIVDYKVNGLKKIYSIKIERIHKRQLEKKKY